MKKPLKDEDIVSLYREGATDVPPQALDDKILEYAKAQSKRKKNWWPYIGLAASLALVTLIAPWRWVDQTMQPLQETYEEAIPEAVPEIRLQSDMPVPQPAGQSVSKKEVMSERMMMKASPQVDAVDALIEREAEIGPAFESEVQQINIFAEVEALLANGEQEKARTLLKSMLKDDPELKKQLPEHLKAILPEE